MTSMPLIEELLPHRGSMLLLDRLISFDHNSTTSEYSPRENAWYADECGNMPAWIGIELMAQTIATHVAMLKREENLPMKHGILLGTQRYTSSQPLFLAGGKLQIQAKMIYRDDSGFCAYECHIMAHDQKIAEATIKVFEPDDLSNLLQVSV